MTLYNLARVVTNTIGVADVVTGAAVQGYLTFVQAGVPHGAVVSYGLQSLNGSGVVIDSEVGQGTWNAITSTLARTTVLNSTNGGAKIVLAGNSEVFITALAQDFTPASLGVPALVSPSVVGNFVSFSDVTGGQADSGFNPASFQTPLVFPLASNLGGTGVNNAGTLTNASNTTITGGGTLALGGFTLTVPATGTAALLATQNVFTVNQMIDGTADAIQLRVQGHSTQTSALQTWETSAGAVLGQFDSSGGGR